MTIKKKNRKKAKSKLTNVLVIFLFLLGMSIFVYPIVSDFVNQYFNNKLIYHYEENVKNMTDEEKEKILNEANEYNKNHNTNYIVDAFNDSNNLSITKSNVSFLDSNNDEMMGYLMIPKISQSLAIFHGTSDKILEKGIGHLDGTSLPIGGSGTHSVLAGHRGFPSAKLFTDLDQMELGDKFYIEIMGKVLAYEVDQIKEVKPENHEYLKIVQGEDYVTLLTCTPYGVNTHRLLIRGSRSTYDSDNMYEVKKESKSLKVNVDISKGLKVNVVWIICVIFIFIVCMFLYFLLKRKRRYKKNR